MKKVLSFFAIFMMFTSVVVAASVNGNFEGNPIVKLKANGQEIKAKDVPAIIYNGRTMVPIYMLEQLGFTVSWDQKTYSVNIKKQQDEQKTSISAIDDISMYIDSAKINLAQRGIYMKMYNANIDEKGLFFYAKYDITGLEATEIINNIAIISSLPTILEYDNDGTIFEIFQGDTILGTIAVDDEEAKRFVNAETDILEFASTWIVHKFNNNLNIFPGNSQNYNYGDDNDSNTQLTCSKINRKYDELKRQKQEELAERGLVRSSIYNDAMKQIEEDRQHELELYGCN